MKSSLTLFGALLAVTLVDLAVARRGGGRGRGAQCPSTEGMMGTCMESCSSDGDCQADQKCCSNGCGHACMAPVTEPRGRKPCKYSKGTWSECDETANTMTRTDAIRRGGSECEQTKTITRPCRDPCKYKKEAWGDCDQVTNMKTRALTLKKGSETECEATKTEERPCNGANQDKKERRKKNKRRNKKKSFQCQYDVTEVTKCDDVTNSRTMTLTLTKGLPAVCEQSKTINKPCRTKADSDCTYGDAQVTDCVDNQKTITRTLLSGDPATCEATKTKTKSCGGGGRRKGNGGRGRNKKNRRRQRKQEAEE